MHSIHVSFLYDIVFFNVCAWSHWCDFQLSYVDELHDAGTEDNEDNDGDVKKPLFTHLSSEEIFDLSYCSSSRKKLCNQFAQKVFIVEEIAISNVRGVLDKSQLVPEKIAYVKNTTFTMFPLDGKESKKTSWSSCVAVQFDGVYTSASENYHLSFKCEHCL